MIENIHNNTQVLQQIEWDLLRKKISKHCHFDSTLNQITKALPKREIEFILEQTQLFLETHQSEDYYQLLEEVKSFKKSNNFHLFISAISKEMALRLNDINQIALSIELALSSYTQLRQLNLLKVDKDEFHNFKQKIKKDFLINFRKFVTVDGSIEFEKHPKLRPLYFEKMETETKIRTFLTTAMNEGILSNALQFQSFDIINDHYVLPIRSNSYQSKFGQIIARSETGHTLFIEPSQIAKFNQKRLEIILKIDEIIAKLELELIAELHPHLDFLKDIFKSIQDFDKFSTRASFALHHNLCRPQLAKDPNIDIVEMFHPLIENPIKNNFHLSPDKLGLIISGPNTGGKTATLKTLAFTQLLLRFAFFIPAKMAKIYLYEEVYFFGNDGQDLEAGLSSFSAEVTNYTKLMNQLDSSHLILIDEIFNSTSSEEASALALAIFDRIENFPNTHIIVSSHHQTLKTILHQSSKFISAHVGFDPTKNAPTYKIETGAPGSSFALNIFESMTNQNSLFEGVYDKALSFLDNKAIHYEKLLEEIAKKENELNKTLRVNNELTLELRNKKASMEGTLKLKIDEKIKEAQQEIEKEVKKAKDLYFQIKNEKIKKEKVLYDKNSELKSNLNKLSPFQEQEEIVRPNLSTPNEFEVGKKYFSILLNKTVTIKKINTKKDEALVVLGNLTIKSPLNKLKVANSRVSETQTQKSKSFGFVQRTSSSQLEYDCRGMRLEAFQDTVHQALSSLMMEDIPYINIIHGHGNGVLKNWLRSFVKNHKDITMDKDESGNDGQTRLILK